MAEVTIKSFSKQIGIPAAKLVKQLAEAGVAGKKSTDSLTDAEKQALLKFLRSTRSDGAPARNQVTLKRKTTSQLKRTSRTGTAHTVRVEVRKQRTFVHRSVLEEKAAAERQAAQEARMAAEAAQEARKAAEQAKATEEEQAKAPAPPVRNDDVPQAEKPAAKKKAATKKKAAATAAAKEQEPAPEPPPAKGKAATKTTAAAEKPKAGRKRGKDAGRRELHVAKGHRARRRVTQRPRKRHVATSMSGQHAFERPTAPVKRDVELPETITVGDLAQAMSVKAAEVIKLLMNMGSMVTINQPLDRDTAALVVEEMGHVAREAVPENPEAMLAGPAEDEGASESRAPVVTVMGHVDHGKTSLLDFIRSAKVAVGEAGGITQHIGAYHVETSRGQITFLDTPGHEAFSAMRARGARATDVVILVVAADDGVKPQTVEAIDHARGAGVPLVVAVNKIDRPEADIERVKQEVSKHEVIPEDWGGDTQFVPVSAKTGEGVDALLESVLLQAELMELKARAAGPATGLVIEARLDRGRGPVVTILVQQGLLKRGDVVMAGAETGRVRAMTDDQGKPVNMAGPSMPVEIQGLAGVPVAGDDVQVVANERKAREIADYRQGRNKEQQLARQQAAKLDNIFDQMQEGETQTLNLVIKADVQGSVEALRESLEKLSTDEVKVRVIHGMVGGISESDVNLAVASRAVVVGFNVRADSAARKLVEKEGVDLRYYSVIYDLVNDVEDAMKGMLKPEIKEQILGLADVRDVFRASKIGAVAGCMVVEGVVKRNNPIRVLRDNVVIFEGRLESLKRFKDDASEVRAGMECGIGVKNYNDVQAGDQIEVFETVETTS